MKPVDEPSREDVIAAMQAAILVDNWLLADQLALDHFDLNDFETDPCRWCGRDAQANVVWYQVMHDEYFSIAICNRCEHITVDKPGIHRTAPYIGWRVQVPHR